MYTSNAQSDQIASLFSPGSAQFNAPKMKKGGHEPPC
jgi:hypothetical protein